MDVFDHPVLRLPKYGDGIGLHRVRHILDVLDLDLPDLAARSVLVTGSNGKGSTANIAAAVLSTTGRTGLFTSPHLYDYAERIQISGSPIARDALTAIADRVMAAVTDYGRRHDDAVGAFEAQFAMAVAHFAAQRVDWLVLEAGIGGRYDPIRVLKAPLSGLASLDFEHTDLLGSTLAEIAFDKLDALPAGGRAVLGESCGPLERQIRAYADLRDIEVEFLSELNWTDQGVLAGRQQMEIRLPDLSLPGLTSSLVGRHQLNNHALALRLCQLRLGPRSPDLAAWREAVAGVSAPGRLETIFTSPLMVVDVGHTPAGVAAGLAGFRRLHPMSGATLVVGCSADKNAQAMLEVLAPGFERIICTAARHKGLPAEAVAALVRARAPQAAIEVCPTVVEAVAQARRHAGAVYVAGGLFLAAEFAHAFRGGDPAALRFF